MKETKKFITIWKNGAILTSKAMAEDLKNIKDGDFIYVKIERIYCSESETRERFSKALLS